MRKVHESTDRAHDSCSNRSTRLVHRRGVRYAVVPRMAWSSGPVLSLVFGAGLRWNVPLTWCTTDEQGE